MSNVFVKINGNACFNGRMPVFLTPQQIGDLIGAFDNSSKIKPLCFGHFDLRTDISCNGNPWLHYDTTGCIFINTGRYDTNPRRAADVNKCLCRFGWGNPLDCATALENGECKDPVMKKVGAILYPKLYGKEK